MLNNIKTIKKEARFIIFIFVPVTEARLMEVGDICWRVTRAVPIMKLQFQLLTVAKT
jgi:hypothetical protein